MFGKYFLALSVLLVLAKMGCSTRVAPKLDFEDSKEFITNRDQTKLTPIIRGVRVTVDTSKLKGSPESKSSSDSESDSDSESSESSSSSGSSSSSSSSGSSSSKSDSKSVGIRTDITFELSGEVKNNKSKSGDKGGKKGVEKTNEKSDSSFEDDDNASVPIFKGRPSSKETPVFKNGLPHFHPSHPSDDDDFHIHRIDDEDDWNRFLPPHASPPTHQRPRPSGVWTTEPQFVPRHPYDRFKSSPPQFKTYVPYTIGNNWKPCYCDTAKSRSKAPLVGEVDGKLDIPFAKKN